MTVLTVVARSNATSVVVSNLLETIANSQKRDLGLLDVLPEGLGDVGSISIVDTAGTTRENNTLPTQWRKVQPTFTFFFSITTFASTRQEKSSQ